MKKNRLYRITNLLLTIKGYAITALSFIVIIFSNVFICNGNKLIEEAEKVEGTTQSDAVVQCSTAFSGGLLKAIGIVFLIISIIAIIIGIAYIIITRQMKRKEGISNKPALVLFILELIFLLAAIVTTIVIGIGDFEIIIIALLLVVIIQCSITSIMLGKILFKLK